MPTANTQPLGSPFPPKFGRDSATSDHRHAWLATDKQIVAVDAAERRIAWNAPLKTDNFQANRLPRYTHSALQYRPRLYTRFNLLTHVTTRHDGGMIVHALRPGTGEYAWRTEIPIPPPEPWTDPQPVTDGSVTEQMWVLLPNLDDLIAVALIRTTRRSAVYCGDGRHFPLPPFQCQTHLYVLDPSTGSIQRQAVIKNMNIGFYLQPWFAGIYFTECDVKAIDWQTLQPRTVMTLPRPVGSILQHDNRLHALWHSTTTVGLRTIDLSDGRVLSEASIRKMGIRTAIFYTDGRTAGVRVNETRLHLLDADGMPNVTLQFKPYLYKLLATERLIFVRCDGHGANLYAFDRESGEEVLHRKMESPSQFFHLKDKHAFAALHGKNIDLFDDQAGPLATLKGDSNTRTLAQCGTNFVQMQYDKAGDFHQLLVCTINLES
jgi:hypothetical protein